jgi:hypothetical protein
MHFIPIMVKEYSLLRGCYLYSKLKEKTNFKNLNKNSKIFILF